MIFVSKIASYLVFTRVELFIPDFYVFLVPAERGLNTGFCGVGFFVTIFFSLDSPKFTKRALTY